MKAKLLDNKIGDIRVSAEEATATAEEWTAEKETAGIRERDSSTRTSEASICVSPPRCRPALSS